MRLFIFLLFIFWQGTSSISHAAMVEESVVAQPDSAAEVSAILREPIAPPQEVSGSDELAPPTLYPHDVEDIINDVRYKIKYRLQGNFLSIDGGGVKGAMVAQLLKNILEVVRGNIATSTITIKGQEVPLTYILQSVIPDPTHATPRYFIDGALGYNNPALMATLNFIDQFIDDAEGILISLGTGNTRKPLSYHLQGGLGDNAENLAKIMNYTSVHSAHLATERLLRYRNTKYYRLQPILSHDLGALDEANNIERLIERADEIHQNYQQLITGHPVDAIDPATLKEVEDYKSIIDGLIGGQDFNRWLQLFADYLTAE